MKIFPFLLVIFLFSYKETNQKILHDSTKNNSKIIEFLKERFHVYPDTVKMDSNYKKYLVDKHQNFQVDSLIMSRLSIEEYRPLNLNFITFDNYFGIIDTTHENNFSVNFIEDKNAGKFYIDFINVNTGIVIEDYCMWSSINNHISLKDASDSISKDNIDAYNSINSFRRYGQHERHFEVKKIGMQEYLNEAFKFTKPNKTALDSCFLHYDKSLYYVSDTFLKVRNELYDFLRTQAMRIRSQPDYVTSAASLVFLKEQVNLLLLQTNKTPNADFFYWIYKNNSRLRIRRLATSGNSTSSYSYSIDEYSICF